MPVALIVGAVLVAGAAALWWWSGAGLAPKDTHRPNVLLITIDTLRWDRLGCYGYGPAETPVIDGLARRGTQFDTAVAHVPLTGPSHASMLTGLTPLRHGVRDNGSFVLPAEVTGLAALLKGAGYQTAGFVSGFPLDRRFGFATGFDVFDDRLSRGNTPGRAGFVERPADMTTARLIDWLARRGPEPWFIWAHYFDPHAPYQPPGDFAARFSDRPYDGEVAFVDAQIGRLLAQVEARGALDRTIVLVTADHGESLGEHGEDTHGVFVYDATLRVPWIMAGPGIPRGQRSQTVARGVDVTPTLADLAGVSVPAGRDGRSLRAAVEGREMSDEPAYVESLMSQLHLGWAPLHGLRSARWKFVDAPRRELYDLTSDPAERLNRVDQVSGTAASMGRQLDAQMRAAAVPLNRVAPDRDASDRLRALGYFAGTPPETSKGRGRDPKDGIALINTLERGVAEARTNPAAAAELLAAVLREDPEIQLARRHLAVARAALRDHPGAIAEIEELRRQNLARPEDLVLLSEVLRVVGREREAREALQEAARLDPRSPEPALTEARALLAAQKLDDAATAYRRALEIAPGNAEALTGLGDVALAQGDAATAGAHFEHVVAGDEHDTAARLRLAVARARAGRLPEATGLFSQVVNEDPTNGEALAGLGAALARGGRPADAIPYLERALNAGQRSPAVLNGLGVARLEIGDRAGALAALRSSLQLNPDQPAIAKLERDLASVRRTPESR